MADGDGANERIERLARGLLSRADAEGLVPTPLDELTSAAEVGSVIDLAGFADEALPTRMRSVLGRLRGKVLGALAWREKTIYIDRQQPEPRVRFTHAHELGHKVLPWHEAAYWGDDASTLDPRVKEQLEVEANQFAAELLFQTTKFNVEADSQAVSLAVPASMASAYQTSLHASFRRYAERSGRALALAVMGNRLPVIQGRRCVKVLYTVSSSGWITRYGDLDQLLPQYLAEDSSSLAADVVKMLTSPLLVPTLTGESRLLDTRRGSLPVTYELFTNHRQVFALIRRRPRMATGRVVTRWSDDRADAVG